VALEARELEELTQHHAAVIVVFNDHDSERGLGTIGHCLFFFGWLSRNRLHRNG
jgi:hypothetical protein